MINITKEAHEKIKLTLSTTVDLFPRIIIKKAGCAGTMIVLTLSEKETSDILQEVEGITFLISKDAIPFIEDITIYKQDGLTSEILIKNNKAKKSCKCGKSFSL